jgi:hypothetical protein
MFAIFIFACGTTHFMAVWNIWHPDYWLDATIKLATAAVSIATAILVWPLIPTALSLPSSEQMNKVNRNKRCTAKCVAPSAAALYAAKQAGRNRVAAAPDAAA